MQPSLAAGPRFALLTGVNTPNPDTETKVSRCPLGRTWLVTGWLALSALTLSAHEGSLGLFTDHTDIGAPRRAGTVVHDAAAGTYTIGGGGVNMWFRTDSFHFVWKKVEGDIALAADISFAGTGGNAHRKGVLMIRQTLEPDSAYADVALHGDGLTSLQFRDAAGEVTHEVQTAIKAPHRLRLEKVGDYVYMSLAGSDGVLKPSGCSTRLPFKGPFYIGLGVCAHDEDAFETAVFANVVIGPPSAEVRAVRSSLEYVYVASTDRRSLYHSQEVIDAVAWAPDGGLFFTEGGSAQRLGPEPGAVPQRVATGAFPPPAAAPAGRPSPDGRWIAFFRRSPGPTGEDVLCIAPAAGGEARELVRLHDQGGVCPPPSWSPDSTKIAYVRYQPARPRK